MSLWILDTDHLSLLQRRRPNVMRRIILVDPREVAITIITAEEQLRGRLNSVRQASRTSETHRLAEGYRRLGETLEDLKTLKILHFNQAAYLQFSALQQQRLRIGSQDLKIASIALLLNAIVVTRNRRDFAQVPDLHLEDWSVNFGV